MKATGLIFVLLTFVLAGGTAQGQHASEMSSSIPSAVVSQVAKARLATAKYAMDVEAAKADGYMIITQMIPNMGYHFLNPKISGFDVTKPPILVYVRDGSAWQLVAIEWVYPSKPAKAPLPGAKYGAFGAACHYKDGSFVEAKTEASCATTNAKTGSEFNFWHGPLTTFHVWAWYPNPAGLFASFNPLLTPFNKK